MTRHTEEHVREIDGMTVQVFLLDPIVAARVATRLSKVISEPLGLAASAFLGAGDRAENGPDEDVDSPLPSPSRRDVPDIIPKIVRAFTDRLDEGEVVETLKTMLGVVHVQGEGDGGTRPCKINQDFRGKTKTMFKVFAYALEVNFSDFFGGSGALGAVLAKARAAAQGLT